MTKSTTINFRFSDEELAALERIRADLASRLPIGMPEPSRSDALRHAIMSSATSSHVSLDLSRAKPAKRGGVTV